jgi:Rrf2 family nitric oxide-sensitive transcriptional repressor
MDRAMRLTAFTDYTLRTLIYLAGQNDRLVTIAEIAALHGMSRNHLNKVVHQLGLTGMIRTVRGRHGGIMLARAPQDIRIGHVVRASEPDFFMADCFDPVRGTCRNAGRCGVQVALAGAVHAYLAALDMVTLAEAAGTGGVGASAGQPPPACAAVPA